jgi:hypothetical protein
MNIKYHGEKWGEYTLELNDIAYHGYLWVRQYNPEFGTAKVFIGKELIGMVAINVNGMDFNGIQISTWNKTHCVKQTIHRNIRKALHKYFNSMEFMTVERANKVLREAVNQMKYARKNMQEYCKVNGASAFNNLRAKMITLNRIAHGTMN